MSEWRKHALSAPAAVVATLVLLQAGAAAFGIPIPPWASAEAFQALKTRFDKAEANSHRQLCFDANRRLRNARAREANSPMNAVETYLAQQAEKELFDLDCMMKLD